ncbi:MAG: hypothetical protein A2751_01335 [Candidatus Doudnabacteria bacterium RIFCSPHIGHO2_01_FULL_46_14]|uniref:Uncharacterized protein n=1 Tax=Candidatus Doudnabacteria bacterium RIFCSPHIGHO2_01_FULL_46_14 TaxID=1817824 RepID=A0A1F5NM97_9BACT|nr:MAG: hypothetical protein A2751_01335 [Candidatus Doudnabacteria bacterium RIFCSPHIGHO2_01_FULL_46_14]
MTDQTDPQDYIHEIPLQLSEDAFTTLEYLRTLVVKPDMTQSSRGDIIRVALGFLKQYAEDRLAGQTVFSCPHIEVDLEEEPQAEQDDPAEEPTDWIEYQLPGGYIIAEFK